MPYIYLAAAIIFEVIGTMLLPISDNFTKPFPSLGLMTAYVLSFYFLTFAIKTIPVAIVYATWAGLGVFFVSLLSYIIYGQVLKWQSILGLFFIVLGVIIVNTFASSK